MILLVYTEQVSIKEFQNISKAMAVAAEKVTQAAMDIGMGGNGGANASNAGSVAAGKREADSYRDIVTNALSVTALFLLDPHHKRVEAIICNIYEPFRQWYNEQSSTLRSTTECSDWLNVQLQGAGVKPLAETVRQLLRRHRLAAMKFSFWPEPGVELAMEDEGIHIQVVQEDYYANVAVGMALRGSWHGIGCVWEANQVVNLVVGWLSWKAVPAQQ